MQKIDKRKTKLSGFIRRHHNLDLILSLISLVLIWRGTWSIADIIIFNEHGDKFLGYLVPFLVGFLYLYFNDFKLNEISHVTEVEDVECCDDCIKKCNHK